VNLSQVSDVFENCVAPRRVPGSDDLVCDGEVLDAESRRRVSALGYS